MKQLQMDTKNPKFTEPVQLCASEASCKELLINEKDWKQDWKQGKTLAKSYRYSMNIDIDSFDFGYQVLSTIVNNFTLCKDYVLTRLMNGSVDLTYEKVNYIIFILSKHGDINLLKRIIYSRNSNIKDDISDRDNYLFYNGSCYQRDGRGECFKAIQVAYHLKHNKYVKFMYQCDKFIENDSLDLLIQENSIKFKLEFYRLIEKYNVKSWNDLELKLLKKENKITKWIKLAANSFDGDIKQQYRLLNEKEIKDCSSFLYEMEGEAFDWYIYKLTTKSANE